MNQQIENKEPRSSTLNCPQCGENLPKSLFIEYLKGSFVRLFIITYSVSFSMISIAIQLRASSTQAATINPYQAALTFAGIISILSWYKQKSKVIADLKAKA